MNGPNNHSIFDFIAMLEYRNNSCYRDQTCSILHTVQEDKVKKLVYYVIKVMKISERQNLSMVSI
jgi:hypothetical protein